MALKECPFCGGIAQFKRGREAEITRIYCRSCKVLVKWPIARHEIYEENNAQWMDAWNQRYKGASPSDILRQAVKEKLTQREQQVIEARYQEGLEVEQVSERFSLPADHIRWLEAAALRKLRSPLSAIEYIPKSRAREIILRHCGPEASPALREIDREPAGLTSVVVRGEWVDFDDDYGVYDCSVCGERAPDDIQWTFCPNCGADMRGGADNG